MTLNDRFGFGAELARWWSSLGSDTSATNLVFICTVRPTAYPAFLMGGVGTAKALLLDPTTRVSNFRDGYSLTMGLTVEVPIAGALHAAGHADLLIQRFKSLGDFPTGNSFLTITLGLTYRTTRKN